MKCKYSLFTLALILILITMGCSGKKIPNEKPKNDEQVVEEGNGDTLDDYSGEIILEPPNLIIYVGGESVRPTLGTYSWSIDNEDGTATSIESDSLAPPKLLENNNPLQVTMDAKVELNFDLKPDSYTVRIWDDENNVLSSSDKVVLSEKGKVIYEVLAHWKQGSASYAFSLNVE